MQIRCHEVQIKFKNTNINTQRLHYAEVSNCRHLFVERQDGFLLIRYESYDAILPQGGDNKVTPLPKEKRTVVLNSVPAILPPNQSVKILLFNLSDIHEVQCEGIYYVT